MSDEILNRVSSFADGEYSELERRAVLASLNNPEMRGYWSRYHLIGDVIRGDLPRYMEPGFAARVERAISEEATVLAPARQQYPGWLKPAAGAAIAATVATVAILGVTTAPVQFASVSTAPANVTNTASATTAPKLVTAASLQAGADTAIHPVSAYVTTEDDWMRYGDSGAVTPVDVQQSRSRLNSYIMNYSEQRAMMGSPGVLPYAKVVGYTPDQ